MTKVTINTDNQPVAIEVHQTIGEVKVQADNLTVPGSAAATVHLGMRGLPGRGVPKAGSPGQVLFKYGTENYVSEWRSLTWGDLPVIDNASQALAGWMSAADKAKLDGIATGATANATNAQLRNRATHTGQQPISSITDLADTLSSKVNAIDIVDGLLSFDASVPLSANQGRVLKGLIDNINTLLTSDDTTLDELQEVVDYIKQNKATLDALGISSIAGLQTALDAKIDNNDARLSNSREWTAATVSQAEAEGGISTARRAWTAQRVRQAIQAVINAMGTATQTVAGWMSAADKTKLDGIASGATHNDTDAQLRDRATHTGTQAISTVTGLEAALADKAPGSHTHNVVNISGLSDAATTSVATIRAGTTKAHVGLSNVKNVALNWKWGTETPTHIWGSQGDSDQSYVYNATDLRAFLGLSDAATTSVASIRAGTTKAHVGLGSVPNLSGSSSAIADTLMTRNGSGDTWCRLFRSTYSTTNPVIAAIYTTRTIGGDYMRPSTLEQVKAALNITPADGASLAWSDSIHVGQTVLLTITNYDSSTSYTLSASSGSIQRLAEKVVYTAPSIPQTITLTINGRSIDIPVVKGIAAPSILLTDGAYLVTETPRFRTSVFEAYE